MSSLQKVSVSSAKKALLRGELVVVATETVFGIAALATHLKALELLTQLKSRPKDQAFSLMVHDATAAGKLWADGPVKERALMLAHAFWPGPLTVIAPAKQKDGFDAQLCPQGTLGIRIPRQKELLQLLQELDAPLAVASANLRGQSPPTKLHEIQLPQNIQYVLEAEQKMSDAPSTVVRVHEEHLEMFREGSLYEKELSDALKSGSARS